MSDEPDAVRNRIQERAAACLDHVRAVRWGVATSQYQVDDGELQLHVTLEVKCFTRKSQERHE